MEKKSKKMDIVTKMSIVGGLGLICILILVSIISFAIKDKTIKKNKDKPDETLETEVESAEGADFLRTLALIKEVDTEKKELTVLDIQQGKQVVLKVDGAVDIKDVYGTLLAFAQLKTGDIIEAKYDSKSLRPEMIQITGQTWEKKNIQDLIYDKENKTIQIGNDIYKYTDDLVTTFAGKIMDIDKLDPVDLVTVKGYKDTIWSITLEKGHGFIVLKNHEKFIGGTIEIGKKTEDIKKDTKVTVLMGVQNIVVAKEGMVSFVTEVIVEEDKEVIIDIGSAQPTAGMVSFTITPGDVQLFINNVQYKDFSKPINLEFGTYNLRIEKANYVPWESKLVVNQAFMPVEINMNKKAQYIKVNSPVGCSMYIDDNYIGIIPVEAPIDPGAHTVTIRKDGYYSKMHSIQVEDNGQDANFVFPELIPMPTQTETP
ncbi:MAG: hypothetical protein CVU84_07750 [Firmicutes bacterium HGW-Firmicutes-1]|jgi:hypothetical protein|nr:MAG: hypothetical protein CVU84_07750 [Firmicutes bacterium HGW-Firmicutes-1]